MPLFPTAGMLKHAFVPRDCLLFVRGSRCLQNQSLQKYFSRMRKMINFRSFHGIMSLMLEKIHVVIRGAHTDERAVAWRLRHCSDIETEGGKAALAGLANLGAHFNVACHA